MKYRRFLKPDPLLVLAIAVGLAVLVTSVAQARDVPAGAAMRNAVYQPQAAPSSMDGVHVGRARAGTIALGASGATLALALREPQALRRALAEAGEPGTVPIDNNRGTTLYVTFATRW